MIDTEHTPSIDKDRNNTMGYKSYNFVKVVLLCSCSAPNFYLLYMCLKKSTVFSKPSLNCSVGS